MVLHRKNQFYSDWDKETLGERSPAEGEYRNAFEIDRDRVIHSTAFRRLQNKTQVYVTGRGDSYRTRLTHSIEVAQIGRSVVNYLNRNSELLHDEFHIDAALVEAACLAHDLGNPPIGHKGESRLNELMDPWGGFEGNAQSLRILTRTLRGDHRGTSRGGMHATRALLDAILKYKVVGKENTEKKAKFLYPDQLQVLEWVHADEDLTAASQMGSRVRSLECDIMDLSDDVAYTTSDLFDGFKQRLVNRQIVAAFLEAKQLELDPDILEELNLVLDGERSMARFGAHLVGRWLHAVEIVELPEPLLDSNRYRYQLNMEAWADAELTLFKELNYDLIYSSEYVRQPETAGVQILDELFSYYRDTALEERSELEGMPKAPGADEAMSTADRMRQLCDWISGMTDPYAIQIYEKLVEAGSHPE